MSHIIPTVFSRSKKEFNVRLKKLIPISKNIHIDIMDGKFVKSRSVKLSRIPNLKNLGNIFEAHLMVYAPEKYLKKLKEKGFNKIIFHVESIKDKESINRIKKHGLKTFIALNPETGIERIYPFLSQVQGVLVMGVHPGKEHQQFIPSVYIKIRKLRDKNKKIVIQVDGGINEEILKKLAKLKVDLINSGSYISDSRNPKETFNSLNSLFIARKKR
ncbi:MAG: ribulose-phosphate 3-epimerase [Nanoarchaeota archaeon]